MKSTIFREYDIRGVVGSELFIEKAYDLGKAIVTFLKQKHPHATRVLLARDGRSHSLAIFNKLAQAITDSGLNVIDIGLCPTPSLYFAVKTYDIPTGLIVTASHNPKEYNGIKMWGVWGGQIQEIKKIYESRQFIDNASIKGLVEQCDIITPYITFLTSHFAHLKNNKIHAIIDCGNGSAGTVMPKLVSAMGWDNVQLLYPEVDGDFPNHEADPTVPENMRDVYQALTENPLLEVGLGLDGDCDRMNPMTRTGELVAGDKLLALYAQKTLQDFPGASIVFDIKSSGSLIDLLTRWGAKPCISPSGHSLIKESMAQHNAKLAGELSCHFFFNDRYFGYDDGIYAMFRLFELLAESGKTLEQMLTIVPHKELSPEIRIKCTSDFEKVTIVAHAKKIFAARKDANMLTIDGIRVNLSYGWGLLRASNTQPVICLRFESDSREGLQQVKQDFYQTLQPYFDEKKLKECIGLP